MFLLQFFKKTIGPFLLVISLVSLLLTTTPTVDVQAQSISDLNILGIDCLFPGQDGCSGSSVLENLTDFLLTLAPILAIFVIMWGGYKYFFGAIGVGQEEGIKTIRAGVFGLVFVLMANIIVNIISGDSGIITATGLDAGPLIAFVETLSGFLFAIAGVFATLVIVWGGYKYYFSGLPGDQENGLKTIRSGVIGLIVVLIAAPLSGLVSATISGTDTLELNTDGIVNTITTILSEFLIPISSVVAVFFFVLGAYYLLTSGGNADQVSKGRRAMINAAIGLLVALLSFTVVQIVVYFTVNTNLISG